MSSARAAANRCASPRIPADDMMPSWSRDGQWVYFGSRRSGRMEICKISAVGGEAVQLTRNGGVVALESVDGRFVYYTKGHRPTTSLWRVPVDGGEESRVLESVTWWNFVVAEQGIYFIPALNADDPDGGYSLQFFDFARGKVKTVAPLPTPRYRIWFGLAVSPDERTILYAQIDDISSDLMLIEDFR